LSDTERRPVPFPASLLIPAEVVDIARRLEEAGFEAWCVGGSIRDALLGDQHADYDLATSATPDDVRALFRRTVPVGLKYGTVGVLDVHRVLHEVTTFRRDVETDGRHAVVAYGASLEEDLARRDFTMNAIAYHPLRHEWRDPFRGAEDLGHGVVRAVGIAAERFREDYLRILRGLRFAARFGFTIEPATWQAAQAAAPGLAHLSAERVRDEWFKGLRTAGSVLKLARRWLEVGAASVWLPELERGPATQDRPEPTALATLRDPILLTTWLCGATAAGGAVLRRLKASSAEIARAEAIARGPEAPAGMDEAAARRWLAAVAQAADDLIALWELRHGAVPPWLATIRQVRERGDPITRSDLAISGTDLQQLGLSGRRVGDTLAVLLDRVHDTPSLNTRDQLIALVRTLGAQP
jgi:tRNA nucleotidyltransferase (CCA-adding enzyme)